MEPYRTNQENLAEYIALCRDILKTRTAAGPPVSQLTKIRARENASEVPLALPQLRLALALGDLAQFCVALALSCEVDSVVRDEVSGLCGAPFPTLELALSLWGGEADPTLTDPEFSPLRFLLRLEGMEDRPIVLRTLQLRGNVLRFLLLGHVTGRGFYTLESPRVNSLPLNGDIESLFRNQARGILAGGGPLLLALCGPNGSGRRTLVRRICGTLNIPLLTVDLSIWAELRQSRQESIPLELALDAVLTQGAVCLTRYSSALPGLDALLSALPQTGIPLFIVCGEGEAPAPAGFPVLRRSLGPLSVEDGALAQRAFAAQYPVPPDFPLPPGEMHIGRLAALWRDADARRQSQGRDLLTPHDLARAAEAASDGRLAKPLLSGTALADVVAEPELMQKLLLTRTFLRHSQMADDLYRREGRAPLGRGMTALFYGPPGTGKTMSVCALANELGMELLRIDLSQIMDKYIGETEKHLTEIFDRAERQGGILFFDEADSLFSKRTEVSSSNDRYANVETAFLLQRIEQFGGVVFLATNLFKNIDEAFMRRITISVRFSLPDEGLRLELWRRAFPSGMAPVEERTLVQLARELELSPATICAAARMAVTLAVAENGKIGSAHLLAALDNELGKYGQTAKLSTLRMTL